MKENIDHVLENFSIELTVYGTYFTVAFSSIAYHKIKCKSL